MPATTKRRVPNTVEGSIRASISIPEKQYSILDKIATENKVSLAWVVRDAIDGYLKSKLPVLPQSAIAKDAPKENLK